MVNKQSDQTSQVCFTIYKLNIQDYFRMNILITDIKINELSYFIFLNIGDFGKFLSEK